MPARRGCPGPPVPEQQSAAAAGWLGHVLAGHRLDALIGEGGMGVVYRATHLRLGRTVALKVLPPSLSADLDYRRRFEREAAIAASLEHPNVVPIYDAGHTDGVLYLSMRFVDGEDLGAVLHRDGPLGIDGLCAVLGPVADALDAVHEAGLVHRDVKPGNVLLVRAGRPRGGQVYLCDFGIAKAATAAGSEITSAGQYMGTPQYSSPEQIEGRWVDGRSDQYGLACLVYRCLTGEVPYPRPEMAAVVYAHLAADPPRPSRLRPDLPAAVDAAVARAAAKHPDHRFPSCTAFLDALRAAAHTPAPRPRPRPRPTAPYPTAATTARPPVRDHGSPAGADRPAPAATPPPPGLPAPAGPAPVTPAPVAPAPVIPAATAPERRPPATRDPEPAPASAAVPAPTGVRAERGAGDPSVTVTWTAGGPEDVEYKISRLAPDGRWRVVGRTRSTCIVDGAVAPDAEIPVYDVVARLGPAQSDAVRTSAPPADDPGPDGAGPDDAGPDDAGPDGIPAVRHLAVTASGALAFDWPPGITEAMVVVRPDRSPAAPDDPAATAWKITNMRYEIDGGLVLPASVDLPCHVAVASCRRVDGTLVVASGFDPTARTTVGAAAG